MKNEGIQFWYPTVTYTQGEFFADRKSIKDGAKVVAPGEVGHIYHDGRLLCQESIATILKRCKKAKQTLVKQRRLDAPLCPKCAEAYKNLPQSQWAAFVEGKAARA